MMKMTSTAIWLGLLAVATAGQPMDNEVPPTQGKLPDISAFTGRFRYSDGMDFDELNGDLSVTELDFIAMLSRPITVAGDITLVPLLQYGLTSLDFNGTDAGFPIAEEDLHSMSLHLAAVKINQGSPWIYGAWARAELASDFQHINGDDFTFDIAGGVGYRFNERFTLAFGATVLDLNGDTRVFPGINFDWIVNNQTRIGLYGPMSMISYTPNEDWKFSLRGMPGGGVWNITDDDGDSKSIDLTSYQVGVFASRRLTDKWWLNAGVGATLFNNIQYSDPDGDHETLDEDMGSGLFGQIGVSLKTW